eukprot:TRINITY_DN3364_c0_g1_i3.p1 TRINITY_DN3364_c0_g1~~TRINITY_DN3364_c0_g1_i3.p1  ORF type:complete len:557 (+),score=102.39 TRINITY_DN3364_c0_g1_i3:38-1672(+)
MDQEDTGVLEEISSQPAPTGKEKARDGLLAAKRDGTLHRIAADMEQEDTGGLEEISSQPAPTVEEKARDGLLAAKRDGTLHRIAADMEQEDTGVMEEISSQPAPTVKEKARDGLLAAKRDGTLHRIAADMKQDDVECDLITDFCWQTNSNFSAPPSGRVLAYRHAAQSTAQAVEESTNAKLTAVSERPVRPPKKPARPSPRTVLDYEAERRRDKELLRQKYLDNIKCQRQRQNEPERHANSQLLREFATDVSIKQSSQSSSVQRSWAEDYVMERFSCKESSRGPGAATTFGPDRFDRHDPPLPPPSQHKPVRRSPRIRKEMLKARSDTPEPKDMVSLRYSRQSASKACQDTLDAFEKEYMEVAGGSRSILDDTGMFAYFDVYRSMVCRRQDLESSSQSCDHQSQEQSQVVSQSQSVADFQEDKDSPRERSLSPPPGATRPLAADAAKNAHHRLAPGLVAWRSPQNPWHWPRRGGVPPMEASVVALLHGKPPPRSVTKKAAEEARRELFLPVVQRVREVALWPDQGQEIKVRKPRLKMRAGLRCK